MSFFKKTLTGMAAAALIIPFSAGAALLNIQGGKLFGATGVDVGGSLYSVTFEEGTCSGVFSPCTSATDFAFTTLTDANAASQALLDSVLIDGPNGNFDTGANLVNYVNYIERGDIITPYDVSASAFSISIARNYTAQWDPTGNGDYVTDATTNNLTWDSSAVGHEHIVWAVWTPETTSVPEPSTYLILGFGLAGLVALRRKQAKRKTA